MKCEIDRLNEIKKQAEENYKTIGKVHCPYLARDVNFNAKGLSHIKFKEWNKARLASDQYLRLKFLRLAPYVIKKSHTLQEYDEKQKFERVKTNTRYENKVICVRYYGFIAIVNNVRIKVVIKELENGEPFFWSIIPFWKSKENPVYNQIKKVFHDGDLEHQ